MVLLVLRSRPRSQNQPFRPPGRRAILRPAATRKALRSSSADRASASDPQIAIARELLEALPDASLDRSWRKDWLLTVGYLLEGQSRLLEDLGQLVPHLLHGIGLDPFLGIGNSAIAAQRCGVARFIGFEIDEKYLAEARRRIAVAPSPRIR